LREFSILNLIKADQDLINFDYPKIFVKILDNRKKNCANNKIKMSEKEDLLIRVIGTSNELDNLRLDDKLLYILNRKLTTDPKSDILKSVIKSKTDLSDLNIIPHLKNQLNVPLDGWSKKEELLYHAVHANKTLD